MTSRKLDEIARRYRVVAMCGVSGAGKTYCARKLVGQGFVRLSSDEIIWQRYGDEFPGLDPETHRQAFLWAAEEIDKRTAALIAKGERIVVDSTMCKRQRREAFRNICRANGVEPLFVYLKTPLDTIIRRMSEGQAPVPMTRSSANRNSVYSFPAFRHLKNRPLTSSLSKNPTESKTVNKY